MSEIKVGDKYKVVSEYAALDMRYRGNFILNPNDIIEITEIRNNHFSKTYIVKCDNIGVVPLRIPGKPLKNEKIFKPYYRDENLNKLFNNG